MKPALLVSLTLAGCTFPSLPGAEAVVDAGDAEDAYEQLLTRLEQRRTEFLPRGAMDHLATGNRLFWLDSATFIPTLHSADATSGQRIAYGFSLRVDGNAYVFKASERLVATVSKRGQTLTYHAFSADAANQPLGQFEVTGPSDEQRWWAYCVDGSSLYYVDTLGGGHVYRWRPGESAPTQVLTLSAAGINLGILLDFAVEGERLVLIESGRLWTMAIPDGRARWLGNHKEADQVFFDSTGLLFRTPDGLFYEDAQAAGSLRDLTQELLVAPPPIADNSIAHRDDQMAAILRSGELIYVGWSGVFGYDLTSRALRPLLLEPSFAQTGRRLDYRNPQVTSDGSLFVVGLTSTSSALGADGPVYRLTGW